MTQLDIISPPATAIAVHTAITESPTQEIYIQLQFLYDHFKQHLFGGTLPGALITLRTKNRSLGYFSPGRFIAENGGHTADEIALNSKFFRDHGDACPMQTMAHEMCHQQQYHLDRAPRRGYHDKVFAQLMAAVGLITSSTGKPGGARTGAHMSDYPDPNGRFIRVRQALLDSGFELSWSDAAVTIQPTGTISGKRTTFICVDCGYRVWSKPGEPPACRYCHPEYEPMEALAP